MRASSCDAICASQLFLTHTSEKAEFEKMAFRASSNRTSDSDNRMRVRGTAMQSFNEIALAGGVKEMGLQSFA